MHVHVQPEPIDQQAAGAGAGLEVQPVSHSGVTPRKRWSLFDQVRAPFHPREGEQGGGWGRGSEKQSGTTGNGWKAPEETGVRTNMLESREEVSRSHDRIKTSLRLRKSPSKASLLATVPHPATGGAAKQSSRQP